MTAEVGLTVVHRRYIPRATAHYGGGLMDGAYTLALFGDAATELSIRSDADEGLFVGYRDVVFHAPVQAGDVIEVTATLVRVGRRSRELELTAYIVCRAAAHRSASAADVLEPPVLAVAATGTVVIPR